MKPVFCHLDVADSYNLAAKDYPCIADWEKVISFLGTEVEAGFLLNFGGPDVLAKDGFFDLVSFSRKAGFKISLITKACLIDETMAKRINDSGIEYVNIAFDLPEKDLRGNFKSTKELLREVVESISYLNRFSGSTLHKGISCVINGINLEYIPELENWVFRDNRIEWIQFMVLGRNDNDFLNKEWHKTGECAALWPKDIKKTHIVLDELIRFKELGYKINNSAAQLSDFKAYYESPGEFFNKTPCSFESVLHVNPIGDVFLCYDFESIGNIKIDDLRTAWQSEKSIKIREAIARCRKNCHYSLNSYSGDRAGAQKLKPKKANSAFSPIAVLNPAEVHSPMTIPKPGFCCIGITNKCILKCKMCYKWQNDITEEEPPTIAQYKNFISGFRDLVDDNFIINFGGGEALLSDMTLDLVRFCIDRGFLTNIASNGWLIDEHLAKKIAASGLNEINLSLDSLNEDTHDYLRGVKGVCRRVMDAIGHLNKYCKNTKIGICSVIYDCNLDGLLPLLDWVNNNDKINSIFFLAPMQPNSTGLEKEWWKGQYSYLWPKDPDKACAFVDKVIEIRKSGHKIGNTAAQLEAFKLYFQSPGSFVKKTKCNLDRAVHVSAVGDIFLCFRWNILGNIKEGDDIRDIWNSYMAGDVRQKIAVCKDNCHYLINCFFEGDYPFGTE
ncbi:MAG: radical SAM protein [Candidatus Omnitrophota bacterium]|nr:radical SAM protein [Candidatus Omnitrophota bacterium]